MSKKYSKFILAAVLCAAMATPALADSKVSGYFRTQFMADNIGSQYYKNVASNGAVDGSDMISANRRTNTQIDNRFRLMYQNNLNEYVNFVYFGEVDTKWGQASKGSIGAGGANNADGVNVETKNVFVDFKVPDSIISARVGIQGIGVGPDGIVIGDDMSAAKVNLKLSPMADVTAIYSKFQEGSTAVWDDSDFYAAVVSIKPSDALKFNFDLAYLDQNTLSSQLSPVETELYNRAYNDTYASDYAAALATQTAKYTARGYSGTALTDAAKADALASVKSTVDKAFAAMDAEIYVLGLGGQAKLGMATLDGYVAYSGGTVSAPGETDLDLGGMMGTIKATTKIGTLGDAGLRATYYTADKDSDDDDYKGFIGDISGGAYEFPAENLSIFFVDAYYNNTNGGRRALVDAAYAGNGLLAINGTANLNFSKSCYGKFGAGYFMALEENSSSHSDKDLGIEVAARVGTKVAEKVDISLGGAYAFLGDFYKSVGSSTDPDDVYKVNFMINVPY